MKTLALLHSFLIPLVVISHIAIPILLMYLAIPSLRSHALYRWLHKNSMLLALTVALIATVFPLVYAHVIGFTPCILCWYQRIFMFPHLVIIGHAYAYNSRSFIPSSLILLGIGASISLRHYLMQFGVGTGACNTVGQSVSCNTLYVYELGYITLPLMALSAFALLILLLIIARKQ